MEKELRVNAEVIEAIRNYWNDHIHDLEIVKHEIGTPGFFQDLDEYRFDKLRYLPNLVDFRSFRGKTLLELGCGAGIDLLRFARGGAIVTGIDLAKSSIDLAAKNLHIQGLKGDVRIMNGEALDMESDTFDVVYAHGVLQYTADASRMVAEAHRVLKPGGRFIAMVYNRKGWLNFMSKTLKVALEHEDAPILNTYTIGEFKAMLAPFKNVRIVPERFPVPSRLHGGVKGFLFNTFFVGMFNLVPRSLTRNTGWHLMAFAEK